VRPTKKEGDVSVHSLVYLILDPAWEVLKRHIRKLSRTQNDGVEPVIAACCLIGPLLFSSISIFFSLCVGDVSASDTSDYLSYHRLDPKSKSTLITLSNFLNKTVRALRRINENAVTRTFAGDHSTGSLLAGDIVLAPLYSLCISVSSFLSTFGQAKLLMEEGLSPTLSSTSDSSSLSQRTSFIHSELLWSQYFYLRLLSHWAEDAATTTGSRPLVKNSSNTTDDQHLDQSVRRMLEYGVFLRQFPLEGDCSIVNQAVNGDSRALNACEQVVSSAFNTNARVTDQTASVSLEATVPACSLYPALTVFPTSILLLRNLSHLTFTGYSKVKSLPDTLGSSLPLLEVCLGGGKRRRAISIATCFSVGRCRTLLFICNTS